MSNELASNKDQHDSETDHAAKVFEESSICAISSIFSSNSKRRKMFRSGVFLLFTVAFLYQCTTFLCYVLKHPTVVDFELSREDTFIGPAYTFCNVNPIKRSKFCAKYRRNCTKPDGKFCDKNPRFCGTADTLILKDDDFDTSNLSLDDTFQLNHEAEDMFHFGSDEEYNPVGPLPRSNPYELGKYVGACFTIKDRVNSPLDPSMIRRNPLGNGVSETCILDPEENELIYPESKAGIMFQVHSPYEPVNPFETGYFMKPGYLYRISVKMTQEEYLTNECSDYTEVWLKNNKTGYRSREACKYKCVGDMVLKCLNCSEADVLYPYPNETFCSYGFDPSSLTGICSNPEALVKDCMNDCKNDCVKIKFSYEVQENIRNRYMRLSGRNESREIRVRIEFPEAEIQKIIHKPQFQVLEIFSLIGGLLAFWIGLSMVQIVEVADCMFQIWRHLFEKRLSKAEHSDA